MIITKKYLQKIIKEEIAAAEIIRAGRPKLLKALANGEIARNEEEFDEVWQKIFCPDPNDLANCSNVAYNRGETEFGPSPHAEYLAKWKSQQSKHGLLGKMDQSIKKDKIQRAGGPDARRQARLRKLLGLED